MAPSSPYTSGKFTYRAPAPYPGGYADGNDLGMSGGNAGVVSINHSIFDESGNETESHVLEMNHNDTSSVGISMTDEDYVRRSVYSWYDDADRLTTTADYGTGDGGAATTSNYWMLTDVPSRATAPTWTDPIVHNGYALLATYGYDAANAYLYTGRERDPETGLQLNRNRFYASHLGRWLTRDPIAYIGSQWSLYGYVDAQPLVKVDPKGLVGGGVVVPDPQGGHCTPWTYPDLSELRDMDEKFEEECCKRREAHRLGDDDIGGVICCKGRKVVCSWRSPSGAPDADQSLKKCTLAHEETHLDDIDCTGKSVERPYFRNPKDRKPEECKAYKVELECLKNEWRACGTQACKDAIMQAIESVLEGMAQNCPNDMPR